MIWDQKSPTLVPLPEIPDDRGVLGFIETGMTCPFPIRRIYYMFSMTAGMERGFHAHRKCLRQLVSMAGAVEVRLESASGVVTHTLDTRSVSLLVPALAWITYRPLTSDAVLLALASEPYDASDYIRDYSVFKSLIHT